MPDNFVQDPYNTQNFNRYGYVLNNPLKYTDPSGEIIPILVGAIIGAIIGATGYAVNAIITGRWDWGGFAMSVLGGAVSGAIGGAIFPGAVPTTITLGKMATAQAAGLLSSFIPGANINVGNRNFSISPSTAFGNGLGFGATASVGFSDGNFSASVAYGVSYQAKALGSEAQGWEYRKSFGANWDDGKNGFGLYSTTFSGLGGKFDQKVGGFSYRNGDFGLRYENDGGAPFKWFGNLLSGGTDQHRTTALQVRYKQVNLNLKYFTGKEGNIGNKNDFGDLDSRSKYGIWTNPEADMFRLSSLSLGYGGYQVGYHNEAIRVLGQNRLIHNSPLAPGPGFREMQTEFPPYSYIQYQSFNRFTLW